ADVVSLEVGTAGAGGELAVEVPCGQRQLLLRRGQAARASQGQNVAAVVDESSHQRSPAGQAGGGGPRDRPPVGRVTALRARRSGLSAVVHVSATGGGEHLGTELQP